MTVCTRQRHKRRPPARGASGRSMPSREASAWEGRPSAPSHAAIMRRPAPSGLRQLGGTRALRSGSCARSPFAREAVRDPRENFHMLPNTAPSASCSRGTVKNREIIHDMLPKPSNRPAGSSIERSFQPASPASRYNIGHFSQIHYRSPSASRPRTGNGGKGTPVRGERGRGRRPPGGRSRRRDAPLAASAAGGRRSAASGARFSA